MPTVILIYMSPLQHPKTPARNTGPTFYSLITEIIPSTESAGKYGIAGTDFTTHAAFLDYDRDGDLDLYLLNHSPGSFARYEPGREPSILFGPTSTSYDQLYRNNGDGSFTNVTRQAEILREEGFGLGVAVSDINHDGWPDIYISNDLLPDDVLYSGR